MVLLFHLIVFCIEIPASKQCRTWSDTMFFGIWPRGYKTFLMLNLTEYEIFPLINVKMPTIVGIFNIYEREK